MTARRHPLALLALSLLLAACTDTYPWIIGCFHGTPDASFRKQP